MLEFVENPNIPQGNVTHVLLGERYAGQLAAPLKRLGVEVVAFGAGDGLDERVAQHADMCAHHLGGGEWIAAKSAQKALEKLENIHIVDVDVRLGKEYPKDVALNVLRLGRYAFGKLDAACSKLLEHLSSRGIPLVDVRQGYAKCSVCVVSETAAITADAGLAAAMRSVGIDTLQIAPGGVALEGYDTGFIGGATGLLAPDVLAFTGRLDAHPDARRIRAFLASKNVRPLELTEAPLFDVGSVLPIVVRSSPR